MWARGGSHVCNAWLCSPPLHKVHLHVSCAFSPVLTVSYYDAWTSGAFLTLEGPPLPSVAATWRVRGAPVSAPFMCKLANAEPPRQTHLYQALTLRATVLWP